MLNTLLRIMFVAFVPIALSGCGNSLGSGAPYDELHKLTCEIRPDATQTAMQTLPQAEFVHKAERWKEIVKQLKDEMLKIDDPGKYSELLGKLKTSIDTSRC